MSAGGNGVRLATLTEELLGRWRQTREYWMDDKGREFEERYMVELESTANSAFTSLGNLERVMRKVRNDCE
jgi:hypothetical protein